MKGKLLLRRISLNLVRGWIAKAIDLCRDILRGTSLKKYRSECISRLGSTILFASTPNSRKVIVLV